MCKSVPQIEAAFTRTSTSPCPTSGTGTLSIRNPRAASIFRSAFIVAAIPASSSLRHQLLNAQSQILAHWPAHLCPGRRVPPTPPLRVGSSSTSIPSTHPRIDATCHPEGIRRGCPKDLNANLVTHSTREATSPKWISTMRALLHLLHHPNLLQRLQILHHQLQRHRPIFRRHRIPNLLRISLPIRKIQHLVRILFPSAPQSLVLQQFRLRRMPPLRPPHLKIVIPKHHHRSLRLRLPPKSQVEGFLHVLDNLSNWRIQSPALARFH